MEERDRMIGKTLGDRYEIIEKVGNGGMATVYKDTMQNVINLIDLSL